MARSSALFTLVVTIVLAWAATATAQCSNTPQVMQCNVPYWCQLRAGGFPLTNTNTNDCVCYQLCQDALGQGQGSTCTSQDDGSGGRWFSIIFDRADGNNNYRGTVYCDPRGGHGRKLMGIRGSV